jgi:hypothetical protein
MTTGELGRWILALDQVKGRLFAGMTTKVLGNKEYRPHTQDPFLRLRSLDSRSGQVGTSGSAELQDDTGKGYWLRSDNRRKNPRWQLEHNNKGRVSILFLYYKLQQLIMYLDS